MSGLDAYLPLGLATGHACWPARSALVTFASVMLAWGGPARAAAAMARARAVTQRPARAPGRDGPRRAGAARRRLHATGLVPRMTCAACRSCKAAQTDKIRDRLTQAGYRSREAIGIYAGVKLACPSLFTFLAFLPLYPLALGGIPLALRPSPWSARSCSASSRPISISPNAADKRRQALQKACRTGSTCWSSAPRPASAWMRR